MYNTLNKKAIYSDILWEKYGNTIALRLANAWHSLILCNYPLLTWYIFIWKTCRLSLLFLIPIIIIKCSSCFIFSSWCTYFLKVWYCDNTRASRQRFEYKPIMLGKLSSRWRCWKNQGAYMKLYRMVKVNHLTFYTGIFLFSFFFFAKICIVTEYQFFY